MSLGSNGWIWRVCCEKFRCNFVARTFALIAPLQPVLHQVYCRNETFSNAPEHYEMLQNMSLGSYGVHRVHSFWGITQRLRGMSFCINCTSSARSALSLLPLQNNSKCTQTLRNTPKHEFMVLWGRFGVLVARNSEATWWHELLH